MPLLLTALLLAFTLLAPRAGQAERLTLFAAASTSVAILEIVEHCRVRLDVEVSAAFAASSTLAKQIEQGAPADVYLSASSAWMDYLQARDAIVPDSRFDLLGNSLVLVAPTKSDLTLSVEPDFRLAEALGEGRLTLGDPDHVPAGVYAKQALQALGVWHDLEDKLARSADVRAALALVERREARAGVVYASDAAGSERVEVVGRVPEGLHPPIVYPVAVVSGKDRPLVRHFLEVLGGDCARALFERHGFRALVAPPEGNS